MEVQAPIGRHDVDVEHARGVAVAQDGGEVVGLVDAVHHDREVGLTAGQDGAKTVETLGTHEGTITVAGRSEPRRPGCGASPLYGRAV